jgi:hypothetical protein
LYPKVAVTLAGEANVIEPGFVLPVSAPDQPLKLYRIEEGFAVRDTDEPTGAHTVLELPSATAPVLPG